MADRVPMRRTRGLVSGLLLVLLGVWAGLAPFIGPYGGYGITPATPWHFDAGRLYFSVLPAAVVLVAGLIVATAQLRPLAVGSALVAAIGGIWLGYGITLTRSLFPFRVAAAMLAHGTAIGATPARMLLSAGALYYAPGTLIVFVAALAVGRVSVVAHKDHVRYAAALAAMTAAGAVSPAGAGADLLPGADRTAEHADDAARYPENDYEQYGAIYERYGVTRPTSGPLPPSEPDRPAAEHPAAEHPEADGPEPGSEDSADPGLAEAETLAASSHADLL
jgi:hypothetical protein